MARTDGHFRLRMPDDIKEKVRVSAERNRRSMTGEIVMILANALCDESQTAVGEKLPGTNPTAGHHETGFPAGPAT